MKADTDTPGPAPDHPALLVLHRRRLHRRLVPGLALHPEKGTGPGIPEAVRPRVPVLDRLLVLLFASVDAADPDHKPDHDPDPCATRILVLAHLSRIADGRVAGRRS